MPARAAQNMEKRRSNRSLVIAIAVMAGILHYAFEGDKPVHIEEPRYVLSARHMLEAPGHPANPPVREQATHKDPSPRPLGSIPAWPAVLAIPIAVFGGKAEALHLVMVPFTVLTVLATGLIAEALAIPAIPAALLASISPVISVHASGLMPNLPSLALVLGAMLCLFRAGKSARWGALGATLFIMASLLELSALILFPAAVLFALRGKNGGWKSVRWTLAGLLGALAWPTAQFIMNSGMRGFFGDIQPWNGTWMPLGLTAKGAFALSTLSSAILHPGIWLVLLGARLARSNRLRLLAAPLLSGLLLALLWIGGAWSSYHPMVFASAPSGINAWWFGLSAFFFSAWFFAVILETRGKAAFLPWWTGFCVAGAILAPQVSYQFLLGAVPAIIMLAVRDLASLLHPSLRTTVTGALIAGTLWLAACLVQADMRYALSVEGLLDTAQHALARAGLKGILMPMWEFPYHGANRGFLPAGPDIWRSVPGRALIFTRVAPTPMPPAIVPGLEAPKLRGWMVFYAEAPELPLRTMDPDSSAGFYGNGWLPYSFSTAPLETVTLARIVSKP